MPYFHDETSRVELTPSMKYAAVRYRPGPRVPNAVATLTASAAFGNKRSHRATQRRPPGGADPGPKKRRRPKSWRWARSPSSKRRKKSSKPTARSSCPIGMVNADFAGKSEKEVRQVIEKAGAEIVEQPTSSFPFHVLKARDDDPFRLADELVEGYEIEAQPRFTKAPPA